MASTKPNSKLRRPSPAIQAHLIAYNLAAMSLWAYALLRLVQHLKGDGHADGAEHSIKAWFGLQSEWEKVQNRSRTGFEDFGVAVKWIQTFALLEVGHAALGLVRSGLATTIMQVSSRVFMVWYVCNAWPQVAVSPFYCSMVFAWSVTEVIRYAHYAAGLLGVKVYVLEWLRYSLFYVLYPLGAGSEAALILKSAGPVRHHFGYVGFFTTVTILSVWPPSLLMMMQHMRRQRHKHLFSHVGRAHMSQSTTKDVHKDVNKVVGQGVDKVEEAVESASSTSREEGKRVTRSRSKQNLKA